MCVFAILIKNYQTSFSGGDCVWVFEDVLKDENKKGKIVHLTTNKQNWALFEIDGTYNDV